MKFSIASTIIALLGTTTLFESAVAGPVPVNGTDADGNFLLSRDDHSGRERWCTTFEPFNPTACDNLMNYLSSTKYHKANAAHITNGGDCIVSWSDSYAQDAPISEIVESMKECNETCGKKGMSCWIRNRWTKDDGTGVEFCMSNADYSKCRNKVPKDGDIDDTPYYVPSATKAAEPEETVPIASPEEVM